MPATLRELTIRGYRSLRDVHLTFGPTTVLAGPNGVGKSNVLSALRLVCFIATNNLREAVGKAAGASRLLHYGPKTTREIEFELVFDQERGENRYRCRLGWASDDTLVFLEERAGHRAHGSSDPIRWSDLGAGHRESKLEDAMREGDETARATRWCLNRVTFYHFHDTTPRSDLRSNGIIRENRFLHSYGRNLAPYLLEIEIGHRAAWRRIQDWVRLVAPVVDRLDPVLVGPHAVPKDELTPERLAGLRSVPVRLDWQDDRGETFGPDDLSDGTLRAIALFTALGQPAERRPLFMSIDEPELGLHPAAIDVLCSVIHATAPTGQVLLATQSPRIIDAFEPSSVRIVERTDGATDVRTIDEGELAGWLEQYSVSQLIDMNVVDGNP